jgi:phosphoribosylpyrophosphate synthetase
MVTHGLLTGTAWQRLWSVGTRRLYCTDTVPIPEWAASDRLRILSAEPLLRRFLADKMTQYMPQE